MVALPPLRDRTLDQIDRLMEAKAEAEDPRPYLGMSGIGEECSRKLWYRFRWAKRTPFDARTLKKFADGHISEATIVARLKQAEWLDVIECDENGEQRAFQDFAGHFRGHQDGEIKGILEAPKTPHCLEIKATAKLAELKEAIAEHGEKDALRHWWPTYFAQAQMYMLYGGYSRHYLVACSPGAREWTSVRTNFDKNVAMALRDRAEFIIFTERPPTRDCPRADFYLANWCEHAGVCFGDPTVAGRNCRTCAMVTPERDGTWTCAKGGDVNQKHVLDLAKQRAGCSEHRFIPSILHDRTAVNYEDGAVIYDNGWKDIGQ